MTRSLLALLFTLIPALPGAATLVLSSERSVTNVRLDAAAFDQSQARMAGDGQSALAVWVDRDVRGIGDILGSRVDAGGNRVDDQPRAIATTAEDESRPAVAWGTGRYLVVWSTPHAVRARFFAPQGPVLSSVFDLGSVDTPTEPHVAFDGQVFLVVWAGPAARFRGAIVHPSLGVQKTFDVGSSERTWPEIALVASGNGFALVTAVTDVNGTPNANGFPSDVGYFPVGSDGAVAARVQVAPAVTPVFDLRASARGDEFLVAWTTARAIGGAEIRGVRVTPQGPQEIVSRSVELLYLQAVGADREGYVLLYGDETTKRFMRFGSDAAATMLVAPPGRSTVAGSVELPGGTVVVVQGIGRIGFAHGPAGGDLYLAALAAQQLQPLALSPRHQAAADIAAAGEVRLAVWCEYAGADRELSVFAARLAADGTMLDPSGIEVGGNPYHPVAPRVASNGADFLVVWEDGGNVYGTRVSGGGALLDSGAFLIAAGVYDQTDVAVSWDGASYVVVFQRGQFLRGLRTTVHASRVALDGTVAPQELPLSTEAANELPAIASGPSGSLVVWRSGSAVQGALLSPQNTVVPLTLPVPAPSLAHPVVAWNGTTFLVAAPFGPAVQLVRVSSSGVATVAGNVLDLSSWPGTSGFAFLELEPIGDQFALSYSTVVPDDAGRDTALMTAIIDGEGALDGPPRYVASIVPDFVRTFGASGASIAYARRIGHPTRETTRVFVRELRDVVMQPRRRAVR